MQIKKKLLLIISSFIILFIGVEFSKKKDQRSIKAVEFKRNFKKIELSDAPVLTSINQEEKVEQIETKKEQEISFDNYLKSFKNLSTKKLNEKLFENQKMLDESGLVKLANTSGLSKRQQRDLKQLLRINSALRSIVVQRLVEQI